MNRLSRYLRAPMQNQFANVADGQGLLAIVGTNYRESISSPRHSSSVIYHMNGLALFIFGKQQDRNSIAV